jgi:hypothetical protein
MNSDICYVIACHSMYTDTFIKLYYINKAFGAAARRLFREYLCNNLFEVRSYSQLSACYTDIVNDIYVLKKSKVDRKSLRYSHYSHNMLPISIYIQNTCLFVLLSIVRISIPRYGTLSLALNRKVQKFTWIRGNRYRARVHGQIIRVLKEYLPEFYIVIST